MIEWTNDSARAVLRHIQDNQPMLRGQLLHDIMDIYEGDLQPCADLFVERLCQARLIFSQHRTVANTAQDMGMPSPQQSAPTASGVGESVTYTLTDAGARVMEGEDDVVQYIGADIQASLSQQSVSDKDQELMRARPMLTEAATAIKEMQTELLQANTRIRDLKQATTNAQTQTKSVVDYLGKVLLHWHSSEELQRPQLLQAALPAL